MSMRQLLLACCVLFAGCGGGAGATSQQQPPPSNPPPDYSASEQEITDRFSSAYDSTISAYETNRRNTENAFATRGQWGLAAHYQQFSQDCVDYTQSWADQARSIVSDVATREPIDYNWLANLVETYRTKFLDYMTASYDEFDGRAQLGEPYRTQYRNNLIDGINSVFDQLQADL